MLDVSLFHSIQALAPWRERLALLHRASPQQSPFTTLEFYETYLANDEFLREGADLEVWFLVAFERGEPVGYLALRRVREGLGPLRAPKLEFLATHDVVMPHVVCRAEDEARCVEAFYRALLARKADWSMLELKQQAPGSALFPSRGLGLGSHYLRSFESLTVSVIANRYPDFEAYLGALDKKFRANLRRQLRHLLSEGDVRFLHSTDPGATPAMLELYLDVERRSWKAKVGGTLGRDPRRVAFFRALLDARMPFRIGVGLVLLDGLPVAGCISNAYAGTLRLQQVAFDDRYARLTPGNLVFPLMMREVVEAHGAALDLMSGFASYKSKWLAETIDCRSMQLFRVGSLLFYKAIAGELRRTLEERLREPAPASSDRVPGKHLAQDGAADGAEGGAAGEGVSADRRFVDALLANLAGKQVRTTSAAEIDAVFGLGLGAKAAARRAS